jgi:large-conductance mechanosensitive channel
MSPECQMQTIGACLLAARIGSAYHPGDWYERLAKPRAVLGWGQFLTAALNFLIIAAVLFLAIKGRTN